MAVPKTTGVFRNQSNICEGALFKKKALISRKLFSQKTESQIFDWVLNTPL